MNGVHHWKGHSSIYRFSPCLEKKDTYSDTATNKRKCEKQAKTIYDTYEAALCTFLHRKK